MSFFFFFCCTCRYLSDLHAPGDPAWQCIYAQQKWILQLMQNCRDEFISGQRGDKTQSLSPSLSLLLSHSLTHLRERATQLCAIIVPTLCLHPSLHQQPPLPKTRVFIFSWMYESDESEGALAVDLCFRTWYVTPHARTQALFFTHMQLHRWIGTINPN